jgi:16S rRNA (guanine1207-N2)-methyltransferase
VTEFSLDALRRSPDVEADNLFAVDATDRLLLDTAAPLLSGARHVAVIGDNYGALTLGAAALGASAVRVHQDALTGELALARNATEPDYAQHGLDASLLTGATVVLAQAPKSLAALREIAEAVARWADPDVTMFVGGRVKHMSLNMNEVLGGCFFDIEPSRARQKSRLLVVRSPRADVASTFPIRQWHQDLGLWICAYGAVFAGSKVDLGTRFLLEFLPKMKSDARTGVDLGCGTGVLAAALAQARPELDVLATDQSASAVASTRATCAANEVNVRVSRALAVDGIAEASVDLIVCNPPFHIGTTVHPGPAHELFAAAGRALRSGGQLWTVFNSHLDYSASLSRSVGPTRAAGRNSKFTVSVSTRR